MTIKAVLFDLDGTLLDIDLDSFFHSYFSLLGPVLTELIELPVNDALAAVMTATEATMRPHPGLTNEEVFNATFSSVTGADLSAPEAATVIADFYATEFPRLMGDHRANPGAKAAVESARRSGRTVVLATNPIFPLAAIKERARWAGFVMEDFDLVTSYENMHAAKPAPEYFIEIAEKIGCDPHACLMVGDDAQMDLPSSGTGMQTFYVGPDAASSPDYRGDLHELAARLESGDLLSA